MPEIRVRNPLDHSRPVHAPHPAAAEDRMYVEAAAPAFRPSDEPEILHRDSERLTLAERMVLQAKEGTGPSGLGIRLVSGTVYIIITLICLLASTASTAIYLAVLAGICASEFFIMQRADAKLPNETIGIVAATCFPVVTWLFGMKGVIITTFVFVIVLLCWYVFYPKARIGDVAVSCFGALYTGLMMCAAMAMRMALDDIWGGVLLCILLASIWANDGLAYLVGSKFGRHKMAPTISPKKSWEGFVGGLLGSVAVWCFVTLIPGVSLSLPLACAFGIVCGVADVLGDLVESRIKRNAGFKDSGWIMPGHGGMLDRCDSQFLVLPVAGLGLVLFGCVPFVL